MSGEQLNIHQLLCKKVAQLTKVVYQLNVKSEDRDIDLNLITRSYESQIDQMAVDNEQKIKQIQEQFKKHQVDLEAEVTKLLGDIKRLEKEKVQFLEKFSQYKKETDDRMTRFKDVTKQRIDQLILEVDALRRENIDDVRNSRQIAKDELMRVSAELRGQNEALAAQLAELEAARNKLQADLESAHKDAVAKDQDIEELKKQLSSALKDKLTLADASQKKIDALQQQLENARSQSLSTGDQINQLVKRIDQLEASLKKAQTSYEQECSTSSKLKAEVEELTAQLDANKKSLDKHLSTTRDLEQTVNNLETKCSGLEKIIEEKDSLLRQLQGEKRKLNDEISDLRARFEKMHSETTAHSESERKLQLALENATKEASFFRSQLSDANSKIDQLKVQIDSECAAKERTQTELTSSNAKIARLEADLQQLRNELINTKTDDANKYAEMEANLRRKIQELEEQLSNAKSAAEKELQALKTSHDNELLVLQSSFAEKETEYRNKISYLEEELTCLKAELDRLNADLTTMCDLTSSSKEKAQNEIYLLKDKIEKYKIFAERISIEFKQFYKSVQEIGRSTLQKLQSDSLELSTLLTSNTEMIVKGMHDYILASRKESESSNSMKLAYESQIEGLRRQITSLEDELKRKSTETTTLVSEIDSLRQKLENYRLELGSLRAEIDAKTRDLSEITEQYRTIAESDAAHKKEIETLLGRIKELEDKNAEMEQTLGNTINFTSAEAGQLNKKIIGLESILAKEKEENQRNRQLIAEKDQRINTLEKQLQQSQEDFCNIERAHNELIEKFNIAVSDSNAKLSLLQKESEENLERERARLQQTMDENALLTGELERIKANLANLTERYESEIKALRKELLLNQETLEAVRQEQAESQETVRRLELQLQRLRADSTRKLEEENQKNQEAMSTLKKEYEREIHNIKEEMERQANIGNEKLARVIEESERSRAELMAQIENMRAEFRARPSRLEDVEQIAQLRALLEQREQELDAAAKAVAYYKRELLAREESYNKRFHKESNRVGTMQIPGVPAHAMNAQQNMVINNMIGAPSLNMGGISAGSFSQTGPISTRMNRGSASPKAKRPLSNNGLGAKGGVAPLSMPKHLPAPL